MPFVLETHIPSYVSYMKDSYSLFDLNSYFGNGIWLKHFR